MSVSAPAAGRRPPVLDSAVPSEQLEEPERNDDDERDQVPRRSEDDQKCNCEKDQHVEGVELRGCTRSSMPIAPRITVRFA